MGDYLNSASQRYRHDPSLSRRILITIAVITAFYIGVLALLIWWGVPWLTVVLCVLVAVAMQWLMADKLVIASLGAREVNAEEMPEVFAILHRLTAMYHIPMPRVAVQQSTIPNAFATGTKPDHSLICVSTALLQMLTPQELEAVLAHELAHIANRDVVVMTMSASGNTIAGAMMRISAVIAGASGLAAAATGGTRRRKDDNAGGFLIVIFLASATVMITAAIIYAVSSLMVRALSRYRELAADRSAVLLTGQPNSLASALQRITGSIEVIPKEDLRAAGGVNTLAFTPALSEDDPWHWLLSTHPTLQQRLENIAKVAQQLNDPHP